MLADLLNACSVHAPGRSVNAVTVSAAGVMYAPKLFQGRAGTRLEQDQKRAGGRGRRGPDPLHFPPQAGHR
jgi:hypothetical protein